MPAIRNPLVLAVLVTVPLSCGLVFSRDSGQRQSVHETADVSLIEVPVNVVARDGKPVRNLTAQDFILKDDGDSQKILAVDVYDLSTRRGASGLPVDLPAAGRRHFLFLFDFSFATPNEIARSRQAALRFVSSEMEPEDLAGIATASVEQGSRLLMNFTSDRRQLAAAIHSVGLPNVIDQARDPLAFAFVLPGDPIEAKMIPAEEYRSGKDTEFASTQKIIAMEAQRSSDRFAEGRVERHLGGIGDLGQALDAVEGRKLVLYFSEGYDGRLLFGNMLRKNEDNFADNDAMTHGQLWSVDLDRRYGNSPLQLRLGEAMDIFRRADCTIYPIDAAGLHDESDASLGHVERGRESLFAIASATGGEVIENSNDLDAQLRRVLDRTSVTYVLSFRPAHSGEPGRFHTIDVRVRDSHARVSARAGYFESREFKALTPLERVFSAADLITSDRSPGTIPVRLAALPLAGEGLRPVPVLVTIPPAFFSDFPKEGSMSLSIFAYVSDAGNTLSDYFTRTVAVDLGRVEDSLALGGFTYLAQCHLIPGDYVMRVLVRDEHSGRFGYRSLPIHVADFHAPDVEVLPPVFLESGSSGLNLRDSGGADTLPALFTIGEARYLPRLAPKLAANSHGRICLMIFRKDSKAEAQPLQIEAEFVGGAGVTPPPAHVRLLGRTSADSNGMVKLLFDLDTTGLAAGDYELRFTLNSSDGRKPVRTETGFAVS